MINNKPSKNFATILTLAALTLSALPITISNINMPAFARGGGGGHGGGGGRGGGGGYRGGGGGRGGGYRSGGYQYDGYWHSGSGVGWGTGRNSDSESMHNFNRWGHGSWGTGRDYAWDNFYSNHGSNVDTSRPYVSPEESRAEANQTYNWGGSRLPTDMGLASTSSARVSGLRITPNRTTQISRQAIHNRANLVREYYDHRNLFRNDFWRDNRGWWYPGWGDWWAYGYYPYSDLCGFWDDADCNNPPVYYDYGTSIVYSGAEVYYGSKKAASADQYFTQAQLLANSVALSSKVKPSEADWKPLGVFSLTQGDQTDSNSVFQLATNKAGELRGNYYNTLTNDLKPIQGKVSLKTGRAAFTVGDNRDVVYDTGVANLLSSEGSVLLHYGNNQTQQWIMSRIPGQQGSEKSSK